MILNQPKPFYLIFLIELWERFGYYGMQAIIVFYMARKMGMGDATAFNMFSAFTALSYVLVCVGGYIGDHILGIKRTLILGAIFLAVGYFMLSLARVNLLIPAMSVIAVGSGLFKANPSNLLSKCYQRNDIRLDGAFTLYYMAVNIGSFFSMTLVPIISSHFGWGAGFLACSIGLLLALVNFFFCYRWVKAIDTKAGLAPLSWRRLASVIVGALIVILFADFVLKHLLVAHIAMFMFAAAFFTIFLYDIFKSRGAERRKMILALILIFQGMLFFVLYQQMPTSLNFFAIHNIRHDLFGIPINPLIFQALNPFWILIMSPILAALYHYFGAQKKDLSMPAKFTAGMFLCSLGFLILFVSRFFANAQGIVSSNWIVLSYLFQSTGELLVSGLGLAMISRFVPERTTGFLMGGWFLGSGVAMILGGFAASLTNIPDTLPIGFLSLQIYTDFFLKLGLFTLLITILMYLCLPWLRRLMRN